MKTVYFPTTNLKTPDKPECQTFEDICEECCRLVGGTRAVKWGLNDIERNIQQLDGGARVALHDIPRSPMVTFRPAAPFTPKALPVSVPAKVLTREESLLEFFAKQKKFPKVVTKVVARTKVKKPSSPQIHRAKRLRAAHEARKGLKMPDEDRLLKAKGGSP